jgi:Homeodomain-like domain-containing protein
MTGAASASDLDRVLERRRAVALAQHYREFEGLSIRQIADRLGRSPATVKAYFYDPSDANKRPSDSLCANAWAGCPAFPVGVGF